MAQEDKHINEEEIKKELQEEFPVAPPTNEPGELPKADEVSDKPEDVEEGTEATEDKGEVPGEQADGEDKKPEEKEEVEEEKPTENDADSKDTTELDAEGENDLPPTGEEEVVEDVEDIPNDTPDRTPEQLLAEIEDLKFEQETQKQVQHFNTIVKKQQDEYKEFYAALEAKVAEEFEKYGIPLDADYDDLKETDPAKFQIMQNIVNTAREVNDKVSYELKQPIIEASENIVFRIAGTEMKKYNLSEEQNKEAANTFIRIMNEYGIDNLDDDIKNKVELSVARAKMLIADKAKEVIDKVEKKVDEVVDKAQEQTKEVVNKIGKKLDDFKEGVQSSNQNPGPEVTKDNVNQIWMSIKDGKEKLAFFAKYQDMIMENLSKGGGMRYTDGTRRW